jgi:glycosyltransferase involved in cell wall biosynthesis
MTDEKVNQHKIMNIYGTRLNIDAQYVLPLNLAPPGYYYNIYTHILRVLILKNKCDLIIDTCSNGVLPKADISYIHYPILKRRSIKHNLKNRLYYFPYRMLRQHIDLKAKIICANSYFTSQAIKEEIQINPHVLYPPISNTCFYDNTSTKQRKNQVITVSRFDKPKKLDIIPYIIKKTSDEISFLIVGLMDNPSSPFVLRSILKTAKKLGVSHRLHILTNVSRKVLMDCLLTSKVYFHSAINEHFGISIVEAMASGCIPVVNDSGGPREFVAKEFRYTNIDEAACRVEKAIDKWSPHNANKVSSTAEKFNETHFSEQFMKIFNLLCHSS